jgi:N-acetylneuraminate synthase/pseudaminic acid synthase
MNIDNEDFYLPGDSPWSENRTLWDLYNKAETPLEWHEELFEEAKKVGLEIFSSPFDEAGVDLLDSLGVSAFKIASPEINHIPLIAHAAKKNKPIILSTGVANRDDIELAIETIQQHSNNPQIILLQCNSAYPSPYEDSNLLTISDMHKSFDVIPGYSDHTMGSHCSIAAVSMGAKLIEKHICQDDLETVDSFFSMNPQNFKKMIIEIRQVEKAIGTISYNVSESAKQSLNGRRSIYISKAIKKGEQLSANNIKCIRPSHGLEPKYYATVLGKKVIKDLYPGDRLSLELIE